ncbi:hypothetical protein GIY23_11415 [Allosaccharopolyspora coralli]|uniref:Uncharacterized protein n=1 Tax=Allosaccharopolyspora coralli TaxID=2665642 RepID=A0A5Q3Q9M9_9PSEU|nr:hypothetical protein [Allosaccharopolyspora coralli]QGK70046.1 hypothetical protein GIY23_11415 [Allosaccharopolyspora coralli]
MNTDRPVGVDGNTVAGRWEKAPDGETWETDFDIVYRRGLSRGVSTRGSRLGGRTTTQARHRGGRDGRLGLVPSRP